MNQIKHTIYEYMNNNKLELDKVMDDFEAYIRKIIKQMPQQRKERGCAGATLTGAITT